MKTEIAPAPGKSVSKQYLQLAALTAALSAPLGAAELIKANNSDGLHLASSYDPATTPTSADSVTFGGAITTVGTVSSSGAVTLKSLKVTNPEPNIVVNQAGGATTTLTNADAGNLVIDMSSATRNFTIAGGNSSSRLLVKGANITAGNVTFSIGSGSSLNIQTNLLYNNQTTGTSTIHLTGAGGFFVGGTNGRITDKNATQLTAVSLDNTWSGIATFSNASAYTGGTMVGGGTLIAGHAGALGGGAVSIAGGTLDLNASSIVDLTLAANKDFTFSGSTSTLKFNLGTSSDQITGNGGGAGTGKFSLTGGTFEFSLGSGFSYSSTYQLFEGFDSGTSIVSGLAFTGFDTDAYQAILNTSGQLSFVPTAVPEPSSFAALAGGLALAACAGRRRSVRGA